LSVEGKFLVAMCKDRGRKGILDFGFQISDFDLQTEVLMSFCNSLMLLVKVVTSFCNSIGLLLRRTIVRSVRYSVILFIFRYPSSISSLFNHHK
jgi:hypothetical protein